MPELLEFVLDFVLELVCYIPGLEDYWRVVLPVLGSLAIVGLILWRISGGVAQLALSVSVVLVGIWAGILWQARSS